MISKDPGDSPPFQTKLKLSGKPIQIRRSLRFWLTDLTFLQIPASVGYATIVTITACAGIGTAYIISRATLTEPIASAPSNSRSESNEKIDQALALEKQSRFKDALAVLRSVQPKTEIERNQLRQLKQRFASAILKRARNENARGNVAKALEIASALPPDSSAWKDFQAVQAQWTLDRTVLNLAKNYQSEGKPGLALDLLDQLSPAVRAGNIAQSIRSQVLARLAPPAKPASIQPDSSIVPWSDSSTASQFDSPTATHSSSNSTAWSAASTTVSPAERLAKYSEPRVTEPYPHHRARAWTPSTPDLQSQKPIQPSRSQCDSPVCDFHGFQ